ncbi:ATPase [Gorgonomyces haynaldii]|nr:ATPase [Gorgonomyces haynaldii]
MNLERVVVQGQKSTELVGKWIKQDTDINGQHIVVCYPFLEGQVTNETAIVWLPSNPPQPKLENGFLSKRLKKCTVIPSFGPTRTSMEFLFSIGCFHQDLCRINNHVFALEMDTRLQGNLILMEHCLYFNLFQNQETAECDIYSLDSMDICVASQVQLMRLSNTFSNDLSIFEQATREIGQLNGIYTSGDVVGVQVSYYDAKIKQILKLPKAIENVPLDAHPRKEWVYFKIFAKEKKPFRIDAKTQVILKGKMTSFMPGVHLELNLDIGQELQAIFKTHHLQNDQLETHLLLYGPSGSGKTEIVKRAAQLTGINFYPLDCFQLVLESIERTQMVLDLVLDKLNVSGPTVLLLQHLQVLLEGFSHTTSDAEPLLMQFLNKLPPKTILVGTCPELSKLEPSIQRHFGHVIQMQSPSELERQQILKTLGGTFQDVDFKHLAIHTAGLLPNDLVHLHHLGYVAMAKRMQQYPLESQTKTLLGPEDFEEALKEIKGKQSQMIGAPQIPNVQWEDIGGLDHVKDAILETIQLPLEYPELFAQGLKKRSGCLLYGPPGTGKTLVAKAVATTLGLNFFSVKGPELLNMYIGESEQNVRQVFQKARDARPCVIFFDELDSVAPKRGQNGDSGGVMDRIVSQLLAELDGLADDVFVIGATNRPDLLEQSLLRPGRFEKLLYLGVADTHDKQLFVLKALTRKFTMDPSLDLSVVAEKCPLIYTGADFYALCADAMLHAMSRAIQRVNESLEELNQYPVEGHPFPMSSVYYLDHFAPESEKSVLLRLEDFESALETMEPSVSASELKRYEALRDQFEPSKGKGKQRQ